MKKIIEVAHVFDKDKFNPGIELPTVRITIEPVQDGKFSKEYEEYRRKQLN